MLIKKTSKNQLTLPVSILKAAGVRDNDSYFEISFDVKKKVIFLKPVRVTIEEMIPDEVIERFEKNTVKYSDGDVSLSSLKKAEGFLASLRKK